MVQFLRRQFSGSFVVRLGYSPKSERTFFSLATSRF